ncbi:pilus assembly FimT family protein [Deinococcus cellulosilyticus]|uniref:Prepilin-type N-terminal cleavage/methylation domain-containing protein n=1 Tax=Deinococcus cellulosilyticus (strain DSM 18568 / NBRC 106333 / KACC 11606 / 5516J-15) TaxID=1223518 RepID=A0A511N2B8_DEIC1|nr:prepilin-type N-terminal cleavage/methylation domain-containing protein [Deinococcus cellulosilyticus]GEM46999.1 hypothetical protein DC3_26340 [Deinococcus cellulosilyticus NBRC 106333 = KACC 11606]
MYHRHKGFTLIELLVVLVVVGILLGIAGYMMMGTLQNSRASNFVQGLVQDINVARSRTVTTGVPYRIELTSSNTYKVYKNVSNTWQLQKQRSNTTVTLGGFTAGSKLDFSTRGFMTSTNSSGSAVSIPKITATAPKYSKTILVTALGVAREY